MCAKLRTLPAKLSKDSFPENTLMHLVRFSTSYFEIPPYFFSGDYGVHPVLHTTFKLIPSNARNFPNVI